MKQKKLYSINDPELRAQEIYLFNPRLFRILRNIFFYGMAALLMMLCFAGCKKENLSSPGCWSCVDQNQNYLDQYCGQDEQDAFNKSGLINGKHTIENFRTYCKKQ